MNFYRNIGVFLICFIWSGLSFGQNFQNVIHLENGSIIRGEILTQDSLGEVRIATPAGSLIIVNKSQILLIEQEEIKRVITNKRYLKLNIDSGGYFGFSEISFPMGSINQFSGFNMGISFHSAYGYIINPMLQISVGTGIDHYPDYPKTYTPLYANYSADLLSNRKISPLCFTSLGYSFQWGQFKKDLFEDRKGGAYIHIGTGFKIQSIYNSSFVLKVGYKWHHSSETFQWDDVNSRIDKYKFNRITLSLGISY